MTTTTKQATNRNNFISRFSRVGILLILSIGITLLNPNFLKLQNIINVFRQAAPQIIIAIGMTFVMLTGGIDLSIGSVVTLSSVVAAYFLTQTQLSWIFAIIAALGIGVICGLITGLMISVVKLPPAVASYGMLWVANGLAYAIMGVNPFFDFNDNFRYIGRGSFLHVPVPIWIVVILCIVFIFFLKFTWEEISMLLALTLMLRELPG